MALPKGGTISASLSKVMFSRTVTPIIVESNPGKTNEAKNYATQNLLPVSQTIQRFNMVSFSAPSALILDLSEQSYVKKIYPDNEQRAFQSWNFPFIGNIRGMFGGGMSGVRAATPQPGWIGTYESRKLVEADIAEEEGITGAGVKVAIIDTGAFLFHPQLSGTKISQQRVQPYEAADSCGHGTHCTTTIIGKDITVKNGIRVKGVSTGVTALHIKALATPIGIGKDSDIIKSYEIAINWGAKVISASLGSEGYEPDNSHEPALAKMVELGIIPVVAVGNSGSAAGTVGTPAGSPNCIAVGSVDTSGNAAGFSSRGPTKDGRIKPDVAAPGGSNTTTPFQNIYSGTAYASLIDMQDKKADGMAAIMGSSMATPHAAGVIALWVQKLRTKGIEPNISDIMAIISSKGSSKNNATGHGMIKYSWVE